MTMTPAPEGCTPAYNGCTCPCHRTPHMFHLVPCCMPSAEDQDEIPAENRDELSPKWAEHFRQEYASWLKTYRECEAQRDVARTERDAARADFKLALAERDKLQQQLDQETAAYTRMQGANVNVPPDLDVRRLRIGVEGFPGIDPKCGLVYAKDVADATKTYESLMTGLVKLLKDKEGLEKGRDQFKGEVEAAQAVLRAAGIDSTYTTASGFKGPAGMPFMATALVTQRDDAVAKINDALKANQEARQEVDRYKHSRDYYREESEKLQKLLDEEQDKREIQGGRIMDLEKHIADAKTESEHQTALVSHHAKETAWWAFMAEVMSALGMDPFMINVDANVQGKRVDEYRKKVLAAVVSITLRNRDNAKQLAAFEDMDFGRAKPVPITIQCPKCAHWHVDEDKEVIDGYHGADGEPAGVAVKRNWAKHPHSTHRCAYCQHEWQPFPIKMPTVGVAPKPMDSLSTPGENKSWADAAAEQARKLGAEIGRLKDRLAAAEASHEKMLAERNRANEKSDALTHQIAHDQAALERLRKERFELEGKVTAVKAELEKALAGPWRPDLRKELDAALAEIGVLKKDMTDAHDILTKHHVVRKWFPNGSGGAGVDRGIYERVQDMAIMLGRERDDADRLKKEHATYREVSMSTAKALEAAGAPLCVPEGEQFQRVFNQWERVQWLAKERDEAKTAWANLAKEVRERTVACENLSRELSQAKDEHTKRGYVNAELLKERDEARELCRSAKADVTTLRGLCKDLENKIQAMVQANAASAWGIAERDKMMKERDAALHQEEIALAALRALRKEADVFEADRDLARGTITELREIIAAAQKERDERVYLKGELINAQRERDAARKYLTNADEIIRKELGEERYANVAHGTGILVSKLKAARRERDAALDKVRSHDAAALMSYEMVLKERDQAIKDRTAIINDLTEVAKVRDAYYDSCVVAVRERDETKRLVNDVCTKLAVPMMSTHDRVQRLADWYLAVRDEHESLVKERDQIREGYRELNSRHVALVEHWAPLKGSASEQALPDGAKGEIRPGEGAFGTTLRPRGAGEDELRRRLEERERILNEIDTLANNAGASTRQGTIQKVRWLVSELGQFKGMHEKLCKEVEAENWAVLQALQQPGVTEVGTWTAMTRLQQIQALVRDRDAWRSIAQVGGYKGRDDLRAAPKPEVGGMLSSSGTVAIGVVPNAGNSTTAFGERPHPTSDRYHIVTDELAIMVHLHLAGSGWATDKDLERALGYWAMSRYCPRIGTITRGGALDDLAKAVDAWAARKVRDPKGVRP